MSSLGVACGQNSEAPGPESHNDKIVRDDTASYKERKSDESVKAKKLEPSEKNTVKTEKSDETSRSSDSDTRYSTLTDTDFQRVASRLGVEVAAIKAVVVVETGGKMQGFYLPGVPVVNFDQSMYNAYKSKAKSKGSSSDKVPSGLTGHGLKEWTQLVNARKSGVDGANMGTFWGMFQIGGFNYKQCGCENVAEFVNRMSKSEREQLELFATFLINSGMVADLKTKNWTSFARKYNGASYARQSYHTKMANAYKKFKSGK